MKDNIAAEKNYIAAIKQRIKAVGATLDLQTAAVPGRAGVEGAPQPGEDGGAVGTEGDTGGGAGVGDGSNPFGTGGAVGGAGARRRASGTNALVRRGGGFVVVNQHFNAPTTDRHREARYALNATRAVFDG